MHAKSSEPTASPSQRAGVRANDVTRRLVYSLALVPIVPAVSIALSMLLEGTLTPLGFDELRSFQLVYSTVVVAAVILIWRKFVLWTMGRRWLTAIISLIPFVQVAVNLPLWRGQGGCDPTEEILRLGQHQTSIGAWVWLLIWGWWGWEKLSMERTTDTGVASCVAPTIKRIAASLGMMPFLVGVFLVAAEIGRRVVPHLWYGAYSGSAPELVGLAAMLLAAFVIWMMIWRGAVSWSPSTRRRTSIVWIVLVIVPLVTLFLLSNRSMSWAETVATSLCLIGWGTWMVWTIHVWPMKPDAVAVDPLGPRCLRCGYSLRGLRATRCPECGDEPTLDELWAGAS